MSNYMEAIARLLQEDDPRLTEAAARKLAAEVLTISRGVAVRGLDLTEAYLKLSGYTSPTKFGLAMRNLRDKAKLKQEQAVDKLDWSLSKLIRIEGGKVRVSRSDANWLADLYGVKNPAELAQLEALRQEHNAYLTGVNHAVRVENLHQKAS